MSLQVVSLTWLSFRVFSFHRILAVFLKCCLFLREVCGGSSTLSDNVNHSHSENSKWIFPASTCPFFYAPDACIHSCYDVNPPAYGPSEILNRIQMKILALFPNYYSFTAPGLQGHVLRGVEINRK